MDDDTFERIHSLHQIDGKCPTCGDERKYRLNGKTIECDCDLQRLLQKHYYAANIGREYHDICLEHFIGEDRDSVVQAISEYVDNLASNLHYGFGLTFAGPPGTGKTFAMTAILKEAIKSEISTYFITFEELINVWGSSWNNDESKFLMDKLKSATILGIDELRTDPRNATGFLANGLDTVTRHRTSNLLPTFVTTNMVPGQFEGEFPRVHSLLAAKNDWIVTTGKDLRMNEIRENNRRLAKSGERRPVC